MVANSLTLDQKLEVLLECKSCITTTGKCAGCRFGDVSDDIEDRHFMLITAMD